MEDAYDVIIIGAGVVGCSIAYRLASAGLRTLNVDALPAAGYGSTSHSSAIVRPFYSHLTACAIAHEARCAWLAWQEFLQTEDPRGMAEYRETGGLILLKDDELAQYTANLAALDSLGVEYRLLDADDIAALYPNICLDGYGPPRRLDDPGFGAPSQGRVTGAIQIDACGHVSDPQLAAHNLYHAAAVNGAAFKFRASVAHILRQAGRVAGVALASGERIQAPLVVNAAGPHSARINQLAGITDPLANSTRAERHEVANLRAPEGHTTGPHGFLVDLDAGVYQRGDGADVLIGSIDPACDPADVVDPADYNAEFTEQWTLQVYRAAQRFPELALESRARGTVGLYDVSADWIPIYDKSSLPGFYLAIGTSGNQFKNAPLIGEIMHAIITADSNGRDHDDTPAVLDLRNVGRTVDLSFYSRRREVQETRSVLA